MSRLVRLLAVGLAVTAGTGWTMLGLGGDGSHLRSAAGPVKCVVVYDSSGRPLETVCIPLP